MIEPASPRAMLVGEANPYGGDPYFALYPDPVGCAGHRLCHLVMGLPVDRYLRDYRRLNLCPERWSIKIARVEAERIYSEELPGKPLVLCGSKVCAAFGIEFAPYDVSGVPGARAPTAERPIVILPHPSGLCRLWGEPDAYDRARVALRLAGALD